LGTSEYPSMTGIDFETATRESGASGGRASGWWRLYGPRLLVSVAVVAVLAGGAVYASRVSESAPKVVYTASLEEVAAETETSLKVDINSADVEELDELPEVGPATAEAIIEYRRANGSFTEVDELEDVPGIGPTTIQKIEPFATV
jgi:competence protein ComEA